MDVERAVLICWKSVYSCNDSNGICHLDISAPGTLNLGVGNPQAKDDSNFYICFS